MQFATKIVILLTAIVGLFKALTSYPSSEGSGSPENRSSLFKPLKPLMYLVTVMGFMLFPIVLMVLFGYGFKAFDNAIDPDTSGDSNPNELMIPKTSLNTIEDSTDLSMLVRASLSAHSSYERDELLRRVSNYYINKNELGEAIKAAKYIESDTERDGVLSTVVDSAINKNIYEPAVNASLYMKTHESDDSAIEIVNSIVQGK